MPQKERSLYLDILKAVCIILVVFGHAMQYGSGMDYLRSGAFLYEPIFIFIYSFHMPLFMLISGFLFSHSAKTRTAKELLLSKGKQLVIPLFCWSFVTTAIQIIKILAGVSLHKLTFVWVCQTVLSAFWGGPWFLWALFLSSVLVIIGQKFLKDNALFYILLCILSFVTPDAGNTAVYKFMFPFFLMGYLFHRCSLQAKLQRIYQNKAFSFSVVILFALLLKRYNFDTYIYTSGYTLLGKNAVYQLHNNCFRFVIGLLGSIAAALVVHAFTEITPKAINKALAYLGSCTLGIYVTSNYLFDEVLKYLPVAGLQYPYTVIETLCVLFLTVLATWLLRKHRITNKLFLGGR